MQTSALQTTSQRKENSKTIGTILKTLLVIFFNVDTGKAYVFIYIIYL